LADAGQQAEQLAQIEGTAKGYLRAASIWTHIKQKERALKILGQGIALFPDATELRQALSELIGTPMATAASQSIR
jgi:hypothetical protein